MTTGLKRTSSTISIGFNASETAPNTFQQEQVPLSLSPLDREVFVVLAINLDPYSPDAIAGQNTSVKASVTTTPQSTVVQLADSNCLAVALNEIKADGFVDGGVAFQTLGLETPPAQLDYIGIIATNDFFVQVEGANNLSPRQVNGKMYGYRAKANADIYAALVQSEILSS